VKKRARGFLLILLIALAAAGVAIDAWLAVRHLSGGWDEAVERFAVRNHPSVAAFASMARSMLVRGKTDFLEPAGRLMLSGGGIHVQVVLGWDTVLDLAAPGAVEALTQIPPVEASRFDEAVRILDTEPTLVDVVIPMESMDERARTVGYVRVVFDTRDVEAQVRSRVLVVAGIAAGGGLGYLGLLVLAGWLFGWKRRGGAEGERRRRGGDADRIVAGPLTIDRSTKHVRFGETDIRLTPKPFALLALLASRPNHVFSDQEILDAVWPTSPYADSGDVRQCVYTLRKSLRKAHPRPAELIENVQGFGYRLVVTGSDGDLTDG